MEGAITILWQGIDIQGSWLNEYITGTLLLKNQGEDGFQGTPPNIFTAALRELALWNATQDSGHKRWQMELMMLMMSGDKGISAFPESDGSNR